MRGSTGNRRVLRLALDDEINVPYLNTERRYNFSVFTRFHIARSALDSVCIENVSIVTEEVHSTADHANEKVLAIVFES